MLRLSPLLLVLAASAAVAQQAPAADGQQPPAAASSTVTATPPAATAPPASTINQAVNARLVPGGVLQTRSTFPLGMQVNLSNSLGNGVLAPGYQAQPNFSTALSLAPNVRIPQIEGLPRMMLSGSVGFSVANWISTFTNSGVYDRQIRVSDARARFFLPGLFTEEFTGISVNPGISASAPLSINSRQANLVTSIGLSAPFNWGSPETPIGSFFVSYAPSASFSVFSQVGATMPCNGFEQYSGSTPRPLGDPVNSVEDLPTFIPGREAEILENGECVLRGRHRLGGINNGLSAGWSTLDGQHSVSLSLGHSLSFLRPLSANDELSSPFASRQNFNESTSGSLSYSYTVPVDFPFQLSVSAGSEQPVWTPDNKNLRFPFWDFLYPAANASGVSIDVTVGI